MRKQNRPHCHGRRAAHTGFGEVLGRPVARGASSLWCPQLLPNPVGSSLVVA